MLTVFNKINMENKEYFYRLHLTKKLAIKNKFMVRCSLDYRNFENVCNFDKYFRSIRRLPIEYRNDGCKFTFVFGIYFKFNIYNIDCKNFYIVINKFDKKQPTTKAFLFKIKNNIE